MSDTQTENANDLDTNAGQADGSPPQETAGSAQADGGSAQGQETGSGEGEGKVSSPSEASVLRAQLEASDAQVKNLLDTLDKIDADPEASKAAWRAIKGEPAKSGEDTVRAFIKKRFGKLDLETAGREDGPWTETMNEFANELRGEILKEFEAKVGRRFQELDRQVSGNRFEQSLEANGIDRETQQSPEFKRFVNDQQRSDKRLGKIRTEAPEVGGELVALRWTTRESRKATNGAERERLNMARGGRLNSGQTRGGASSRTSPPIDRYDPQRAEKLIDLMFRKNVKPEDIDFRAP